MGNIRIMDESLATLIAAGEVVENPASVVKELLENALDAKAKTIEITLKEGGLSLIQVKDDGLGMDEADLHLATKRHATSKLKTVHDLYHILSLGFRGEALASIAQVAKLSIESSTSQNAGFLVDYREGQPTNVRPGEARQGTTVRVQDLFYHTPARLKYLKTANVEFASILNYLHKLALAHPRVSFTLTHDDKRVFQTTGDGDQMKILYAMYGAAIVKDALPYETSNQYYHIQGVLIKPAHSRSIRQHMHLLVNGRIVTNDKLLNAIKKGYQDVLPPKRYPIVFLAITCDPLLLDVNIHPQKLELKFTEEQALLSTIQGSIESTLKKANLILKDPYMAKNPAHEQPRLVLDETLEDTPKKTLQEIKAPYVSKEDPIPPLLKPSERTWPELEYIGQAQGTYLIFQGHDGLYLIDQHAAAERIRYERYFKAMQQPTPLRHPLLIPITLSLSHDERVKLSDLEARLSHLGLSTHFSDDHTLNITEIPSWFEKGQEEVYAEAMVVQCLEGTTLTIGPLVNQLAKDLACKHSVKGNTYLSREEVDRLMKDLKSLNNPFHCPHGRPTIIELSTAQLEKLFQRVAL